MKKNKHKAIFDRSRRPAPKSKSDFGFDKTVKLIHTIPTVAVATQTLTLIN